ncbi:MAG: hypothetical protein J6J16_08175 [Lachnospiraceae bacterium]|nr:hypothetical protein [Lachnospiraceae bacterium]MBP3621719.1 hypothetical protein [Lachnospiraceae bacterium]
MRIIIDTEKELIIVPDTYYKQIDKKNEVLVKAGAEDKKLDYVQYVKDSFDNAIKNPMLRKSDLRTM